MAEKLLNAILNSQQLSQPDWLAVLAIQGRSRKGCRRRDALRICMILWRYLRQ